MEYERKFITLNDFSQNQNHLYIKKKILFNTNPSSLQHENINAMTIFFFKLLAYIMYSYLRIVLLRSNVITMSHTCGATIDDKNKAAANFCFKVLF